MISKQPSMVLLLLLAACAPSTDLIQHGNEWVQVTQTYRLFGHNVVERTKCDTLYNGFCPADAQPSSSHAVVEAPGPGIIKTGMLVGGFITGMAMLAQAEGTTVTQTQTTTGSPVRTSTLLINGPVPGGVAP